MRSGHESDLPTIVYDDVVAERMDPLSPRTLEVEKVLVTGGGRRIATKSDGNKVFSIITHRLRLLFLPVTGTIHLFRYLGGGERNRKK